MVLPAEGRSASTATTRLWCDSGDLLCYPPTFRTLADVTAQ